MGNLETAQPIPESKPRDEWPIGTARTSTECAFCGNLPLAPISESSDPIRPAEMLADYLSGAELSRPLALSFAATSIMYVIRLD